jgi:hypothetical protein
MALKKSRTPSAWNAVRDGEALLEAEPFGMPLIDDETEPKKEVRPDRLADGLEYVDPETTAILQ